MDPKRVVVFFDWQNVYKRARHAFFDEHDEDHTRGQTDAVDLALTLLEKTRARHDPDVLELEQIRIYRGRPTQQQDAKGYNAFQRQDGRWRRNNKIHTVYRDLKYPWDWGQPGCEEKPREKGVDVAIAVDLVTMAREEAYDIAILMSADFDLQPAVDYVQHRHHMRGETPVLEVAAWKAEAGARPLRLKAKNLALHCHWLDRQDYYGAEDSTNYRLAPDERKPVTGPWPGGWLR